jgi:simple sugar transport system substrate-binding protein
MYFYLYNLSGGTVSPSDTDTGLTFVTKPNAKPFTASSRFQGSTPSQKYLPRPSGAISNPPATTST